MPETRIETPEIPHSAAFPPAAVTDYPDRFLQCRTLSHNWTEMGLPTVHEADGMSVVNERLYCSRCDKQRVDERSLFGRLLRRNYRQTQGYWLGQGVRKEMLAGERVQRLLSRMAARRLETATVTAQINLEQTG